MEPDASKGKPILWNTKCLITTVALIHPQDHPAPSF